MSDIPKGFCKCGCGAKTRLASKTSSKRGWVKGEPLDYIHGHHARGSGNHNWSGGRFTDSRGYVQVKAPEHPRATARGYVPEHVLKAENALGKPLPAGAEVHHANGHRSDNRNRNLVICQDNAYHSLIEQRTRALEVCGHADWLKCRFCGEYDDPKRMYVHPRRPIAHHRSCAREYEATRKAGAA